MRNSATTARLQRYLPIVAGTVLIALFARLGVWQLDRAAEKQAIADALATPADASAVTEQLQPAPYQAIVASGRYLADRQILIDNVVSNGHVGYYVITPFEWAAAEPLLLVNRGWVDKHPGEATLPDITMTDNAVSVTGRAGRLPRVGIRPGEAFVDRLNWPRVGVWPTNLEVAAEVGRDVMPYVLLLDPGEPLGFLRQWQPRESGTSTHYGYAFQWFAMAIAVAAIVGWQLSRERSTHGR